MHCKVQPYCANEVWKYFVTLFGVKSILGLFSIPNNANDILVQKDRGKFDISIRVYKCQVYGIFNLTCFR